MLTTTIKVKKNNLELKWIFENAAHAMADTSKQRNMSECCASRKSHVLITSTRSALNEKAFVNIVDRTNHVRLDLWLDHALYDVALQPKCAFT